jgi:hypothetical protein
MGQMADQRSPRTIWNDGGKNEEGALSALKLQEKNKNRPPKGKRLQTNQGGLSFHSE